MPQQNRHLAAILFTDIVGYTAMMQKDEQGAVAIIKRHHAVIGKHRGVSSRGGAQFLWRWLSLHLFQCHRSRALRD